MSHPRKRKPLFERLKSGLEEGIQWARGEIDLKTTVLEVPDLPPEIQADELTSLRLSNRMSQADFARLLNISIKTVQSWEQGKRKPSQAALRLIQVFQQNPAVVFQVAGMAGSVTRKPGSRKKPT